MDFQKKLQSHTRLAKRANKSRQKLELVRNKFEESGCFDDDKIMVFCAGSLARLEFGKKSDLDLFITTEENFKPSRLEEYTLYSHLIRLNDELKFPSFSNDGEYLKIYSLEELKKETGSRKDDNSNSFTVRMLLLLESNPIFNKEKYYQHLDSILQHYYRDEKGKEEFRPLFLLNDLLRYWRTVCLNYEEIRSSQKPWRKKNINLKFSRMLTVFATVLLLVVKRGVSIDDLKEYCKLSPLDRLATGLNSLEDKNLFTEWTEILDIYEDFLAWKEDEEIEKHLKTTDKQEQINSHAKRFSDYLYKALSHENILLDYRKYLVL